MDQFVALRTFCEVARLESFAEAARRLGMSAPTASRIVSDLEADLGVRLLNRTTRQVSPTEVGAQLLSGGIQILEDWSSLRNAARSLHDTPRGVLKVTSAIAFGTERIAPLAARFQELYPDVRIDLHISNRRTDIVHEAIDVAIRLGSSSGGGGLDDTALVARRIFAQRQIFVATPDYLAANGTPRTLDALAGHRIIKQVSGAWGAVTDLLEDGVLRSVRLDERYVVNSPNAAHRAVAADGGIGLVADYLVADDLAGGRLVRILPAIETPEQPIFAVFAHRARVPAKIRLFVDFLAAEFASEEKANRVPG